MNDILLLDHGSGGKASHRLIKDVFFRHFDDPRLLAMNDAAVLDLPDGCARLTMSTDSYVVDPIFFPGGDIGKLAVHGTVNDVSMLGAEPLYLSCGFIIEEGLPLADLEKICASMAEAAREAGVAIVTGDTKVVPRGAADKIFINTTGVGRLITDTPPAGDRASPGDAVLVSGEVGDHGLTILSVRQGLAFGTSVQSDSAPLNDMVMKLVETIPDIHVLRDPTRGGLATTLNEIAEQSGVGVMVEESLLPVNEKVRSGCSFLGLDPLYLANEGKLVCVLPEAYADMALSIMRDSPYGEKAVKIGVVTAENPGKTVLRTRLGGHRLLGMLEGEQLPRIC